MSPQSQLGSVSCYRNYLLAVTGNTWTVVCPNRYCMVDGVSDNQESAHDAAKSRIDRWVKRTQK